MFYQNYELKYVDLSNFELSPFITNIRGMFEYSSSLFLNPWPHQGGIFFICVYILVQDPSQAILKG